mmetsp:Transcript_126922/g.353427  ORF Transcript_126922/g.353427 Transcript_126922/m.353427 type:complete len:259 (+) Transcript_126922:465-1241(+)
MRQEGHRGDGERSGQGIGEGSLVRLIAEVPDVDATTHQPQEDHGRPGRAPDSSGEVRRCVRRLEEVLLQPVLPEIEGPICDPQEDLWEELGALQRQHRAERLRDCEHLLDNLWLPVLLHPGGRPIPKDELALLGGGEEVGQLPVALVVVPVPAIEDVAATHLGAAVLPLQLDAVDWPPDEVVVVDAVQQRVEVPDQELAVAGDREEVLHRCVPRHLPSCDPAALLDLELRRQELDAEDGPPVRLVDERDLLVRNGRNR